MGNDKLRLPGVRYKYGSIFIFILYFTFSLLLFTFSAAADEFADITADEMEYLSQSNTLVARGNATIKFGDATLSADEMLLDNNTSDAVAIGNVVYTDNEALITSDRIEINLKTKLGTIHNSYIYYKEHNFHVRSGQIRKIGDKTFFLDNAHITTCDADKPEWHIVAKDITATQHKSLTGWHSTFNIGNIPVLYTPYFWAPLNRERQTGLLFPSFGYSSTRGYYFKQGLFWAIKENQDATMYLDYYGKKGLGEGLDYRYVLSPGSNGELWLYHVRDRQPFRSLAEIKGYHNQKLPYDISGYLKLHAVNERDYYETMDSTSRDRFGLSTSEPTDFGFSSEERLQKYLESNLHLSQQYKSGRAYLLSQGRQSLEGSSSEIPQRLPELGFILNTHSIGPLSYNMAATGVNFWREKGQEGMRLDVYPNVYLSYGRLFNVTQKVGLRETVYSLNETTEYEDRFLYDLETTLTTKLIKRYSTVIHLIEPSLEYTYIPYVEHEVPFFDSVDSIPRTSDITYALTNRVSGFSETSLESRFRLSQSYSLLNTEEPFTPLLAEASLSSDIIGLGVNASYDIDDKILTELIGSVNVRGNAGLVEVGKNLRQSTELDQYTFEAVLYHPITLLNKRLPIELRGKLWYDTKNGRIQELNLSSAYKKQCWGFSVTYNERPDEYQVIFAVEFTGLGTVSLGSI